MATLEGIQKKGYYTIGKLEDICQENDLKFVMVFGT